MLASRKAKSLLVALSKVTTGVSGFLVLIALTRTLPKADVASYQQVFLVYALFAPFLQLGIGQGFYYFLPIEQSRHKGRIADAIVAMGATGIVFALFIALGGNKLLSDLFGNPALTGLLLLLVPYAIFATPASQAQHALISQGLEARATGYTLAREILLLLATLVPLYFFAGVKAPLTGHALVGSTIGIAAIVLMLRSSQGDSMRPSIPAIRELVAYSFPLGLALMFGALSKQLDKFIVSAMSEPETFAIYSLGAIEIPLITIVTGSITAVVMPDLRKATSVGDYEEAKKLFRLIAEKSGYILLPAMCFFAVSAETFISVFFTKAYSESATPFRIYLTLIPFRIVLFGSLLAALGNSKEVLKITAVGLLINLAASFALVSLIGPNGAAIATVSTMALWGVPRYLNAISKTSEIDWKQLIPWRCVGQTLAFLIIPTCLIAGIEFAMQEARPIARLALETVVFGAFLLVWWGRGKLFNWRNLDETFSKLKQLNVEKLSK